MHVNVPYCAQLLYSHCYIAQGRIYWRGTGGAHPPPQFSSTPQEKFKNEVRTVRIIIGLIERKFQLKGQVWYCKS